MGVKALQSSYGSMIYGWWGFPPPLTVIPANARYCCLIIGSLLAIAVDLWGEW